MGKNFIDIENLQARLANANVTQRLSLISPVLPSAKHLIRLFRFEPHDSLNNQRQLFRNHRNFLARQHEIFIEQQSTFTTECLDSTNRRAERVAAGKKRLNHGRNRRFLRSTLRKKQAREKKLLRRELGGRNPAITRYFNPPPGPMLIDASPRVAQRDDARGDGGGCRKITRRPAR